MKRALEGEKKLTIAILIEKGEGFLEFSNLFFGELIGGHCFVGEVELKF